MDFDKILKFFCSKTLLNKIFNLSVFRDDEQEEDPPVQGPLPYEPDDAPWKKTNETSGVRKLYVSLNQFCVSFLVKSQKGKNL